MNQEKIGKFISECRKKKNMTQSELAEKLGVSDRSIGNWENGRNMPDLSLFKPLCDELGISINELISGEKIKKEKYQEKFEENMINTIDYSTKKIRLSNNTLGIILLVLGIIISMSAFSIFPSDSSWGSIYSILGVILSSFGLFKLSKQLNILKRIIICVCYCILAIGIFVLIDYVGVISLNQMPRYCLIKEWGAYSIKCESIFYDAYWVNYGTPNEYVLVDTKKEYTEDTLPVVPFNRNKSGIDNIIKYKNKYVGNNSNTGNLIRNLPLSEYGYVFEIDSKTPGLTIDYHITDWYINENYYLEKSIVYNSVSIFSLIDNVSYIKYNFSGKTYLVNRSSMSNIPGYNEIIKDGINKEAFNKYLESKINDIEFIDSIFKNIIN